MIPLTPVVLIGAAQVMAGNSEDEHARGQLVRRFLREVDMPYDAPWSAAFIHYVGYWSHFEPDRDRSSWPLPRTGDCNDLARFAAEHGVLSDGLPRAGDIYMMAASGGRGFARAGIVVKLGQVEMRDGGVWYDCLGIEGNTSEAGCAAGPWIRIIRQRLCPSKGDRLIQWVELESRDRAVGPIRLRAA